MGCNTLLHATSLDYGLWLHIEETTEIGEAQRLTSTAECGGSCPCHGVAEVSW